MNISAQISNQHGQHAVRVTTNGSEQLLTIPPRKTGVASSVNGAELLMLALATCYCNDIYREAQKRGITIEKVQVEATGEFGAEGATGRNIRYRASVDAKASREEILELMRHTDTIAEIQNTLRSGTAITLAACEARSV